VLTELGIDAIPADSSQTNVRIERLLVTFLDRLYAELELAG
jgi:hypothetical protein